MKDEAYYVIKIKDLKKVKLIGNALIAELGNSKDGRKIEVWSSGFDEKEIRKPTHGQKEVKSVCLMARSTSSESKVNSEISDPAYPQNLQMTNLWITRM